MESRSPRGASSWAKTKWSVVKMGPPYSMMLKWTESKNEILNSRWKDPWLILLLSMTFNAILWHVQKKGSFTLDQKLEILIWYFIMFHLKLILIRFVAPRLRMHYALFNVKLQLYVNLSCTKMFYSAFTVHYEILTMCFGSFSQSHRGHLISWLEDT